MFLKKLKSFLNDFICLIEIIMLEGGKYLLVIIFFILIIVFIE